MRSWEKLWGVPHFLWEDFKLFEKCKLVDGGGGGKGDTNSETLLVGYIYPYCVWISINGCFGFWGVGHVPVDVQPIFMSFVTFSSSLMPLFQGHAGARSIHIRTYAPCTCTAEINYGKIIHFLFPEKAFLHHLIGMTGTFFILYLCLCVGISFTFYYSLILMVSLLFFP